ncbi:MAG TPA: ester cyclase [Candidatus Dormibacteraeota bacterium]
MSEQNKEVVRRIEEAWDSNDLDTLDALFAPDFTSHATVSGLPPGLAGAKLAHQTSLQSFPDRKVTIEDITGDDELVAVRCRMTGTNQGGLAWAGVPANGNRIDVEWISLYRLRDGQVVEHRAVMDVMGLMQQLGAIPSPA